MSGWVSQEVPITFVQLWLLFLTIHNAPFMMRASLILDLKNGKKKTLK
jgi:hypothetical protein